MVPGFEWLHALTFHSSSISGAMIHAVWEGMLLAAAVALLLRFLPEMSAAARSLIWAVVLLLLVSLHVAAILMDKPSAGQVGGISGIIHVDMRWSLVIAGLWASLSLLRGIQLLISAVSLRRMARRAKPLPLPEGIAIPSRHRKAEICVSEDVERPCVAGFLSPRILLPASLLEKLSSSDMTQIILHEMEHLRRADDWTNLLQKISLVLFPLNPALFWVERQLCVERELACDDSVLHATKARKAYAACLANLAEHSMLRRSVSLALGAWERQSELALRVHRILRGTGEAMSGRQMKFVTGLVASMLMGGTFALAHSPRLVSFTTPASRMEAVAAPVETVPTAEIVKTAYHEPQAAPKLIKTALSPAQSKPVPVPLRKHTVKHVLPVRKAGRPDASWYVLTEWHETTTMRRHVRPAVAAAPQPARVQPLYAAVPVPDGWLIIQL